MQSRFNESPSVPVRIGLHTGDIIEREGDVYGDGVNIASRLENMGKPGTILFSKSIYEKIQNHKDLEIASLGRFKLKNIHEPLEVYALANKGLTVPQPQELTTLVSKPVSITRSKFITRFSTIVIIIVTLFGLKLWNDVSTKHRVFDKSIAVLPFRNDSNDPSNEYFCNGMMEDILTQLQKIGDLKVVSRSSVMPYQNTRKSVRTIADELNVQFVLEGGVRMSDDQIRVTTQLINGNDELQVWAGTFDDQMTAQNIFDIQGNIVSNIATELQAEISPTEQKIMDEIPTNNLEAYDNYLRGLYFYNNRFGEGQEFVFNAVRMFENAVDLDPLF
ncbi:MAG: adenylate/guanylate cyclase domain-containing protein, partial [Saprospiraceae bacterium]|nr:adenylate/guanylate cyclase domain-containing protein [Saprospiraceae bacterium]